jgi:hypothetical protein
LGKFIFSAASLTAKANPPSLPAPAPDSNEPKAAAPVGAGQGAPK